MLALAIETSGRIGSVALVQDGVVLAWQEFSSGFRHAAELIPRIDHLMRSGGWRPEDLTEIYVSAGPGSFTGLRIGITLAKTLGWVNGASIVAVPTARVLTHNAPVEARNVIVVLDAKRQQIYTARFSRQPAGAWNEDEPAHLDSLAAMLQRSPRPVHLIGEGIPIHQQSISDNAAQVIITPADLWQARVQPVAAIGYQLAREGMFTDPSRLTPIYLRLPEAEERLDAAAPKK